MSYYDKIITFFISASLTTLYINSKMSQTMNEEVIKHLCNKINLLEERIENLEHFRISTYEHLLTARETREWDHIDDSTEEDIDDEEDDELD